MGLLSSFADDQDAEYVGSDRPILELSLEEVVDLYYRQECKRGRNKEPESKAAAQVDGGTWPAQLRGSLDLFADATSARSRSTLTKCAVYPMARWFSDVLRLDALVEDYKQTDKCVREIREPFLQKTLMEQLEASTLRLPEPESRRMQVEIIGWFQRRLSRYAERLGIHQNFLLGIGLEWFLSTVKDISMDETNIVHRYHRDARLMEMYVTERRMDLLQIRGKAELRKQFIICDGSYGKLPSS